MSTQRRVRRPTIKDVVERSGFSIGTVSNVINSPELVAPGTKARVREAIEELGYRPTAAARSLKARRSFMLAYPLFTSGPASIMGEFFYELVTRAEEHQLGVMAIALEPGQHEAAFGDLLDTQAADAVVLSEVLEDDERVKWLLDNDVPFGAFGRAGADYDYNWVDIDIEGGMAKVAAHLLDEGHDHFGFIEWDGQPTNRYRREGFQRILRERDVDARVSYIDRLDFSAEAGYRAGSRLLAGDDRPSAIVCTHDILAAGVMRAACEQGLVVGTDIAVTGFDDTPVASATAPELTSVRFPLDRVARRLVDMIVHRIAQPTVQTELIDVDLVVRRSSSPLTE